MVCFLEGNGRKLWIGADGANADEFLHPGLISGMDQLSAHNQIAIEQFGWLLTVQANSANMGSEVNHYILLGNCPLTVFHHSQIAILRSRDCDLVDINSDLIELLNDLMSWKPCSTRH